VFLKKFFIWLKIKDFRQTASSEFLMTKSRQKDKNIISE
jgi:hypothetical protein